MQPTSRPRNCSIRTTCLVTLVVLAIAVAPEAALGWGRIGHRVSARLTETLLTPATKAAIRDLLAPGESLADASTWPDEIRRDRPETGPWHYVNVPITEKGYNPDFCQAQGCVVGKIPDFVATLKDPKSTRDQKREALKFLVHCVQDMHQPVHVGDRGDRGGNDLQVQFFDEGSNLHRVWDSGLLDRVVHDEGKTFDRLKPAFTDDFVKANSPGSVIDWANESHAAARDAYNDPTTGEPLKKGAKLGEDYQARNIPVAERRVLQAAARLARLLNEAFDPVVPTPTP
jgi:nuclease S1